MRGVPVKTIPVTSGFPLPTRYAAERAVVSRSHGVSG